jgi:hypothetical protein
MMERIKRMDNQDLQFKVIIRADMRNEFITYYPFLSSLLKANKDLISCAKIELNERYLGMVGFDSQPDLKVYLPHEFVLYYLSLGKNQIHGFDISQLARADVH